MTACSPQVNSAGCGQPSAPIAQQIQSHLTVDGQLRNAQTYSPTGSSWTFVSVERRTPVQVKEKKKGTILTFALTSGNTTIYAVDERARKDSAFQDAPFDVRKTGAIESRGCVETARHRHDT